MTRRKSSADSAPFLALCPGRPIILVVSASAAVSGDLVLGHAAMNLLSHVPQIQESAVAAAGPHMTWATSSVGRSISRTGVFLKKQIWIWPIIAVVLLSIDRARSCGGRLRRRCATSLQSQLQTLLDLEAAMLETWFQVQKSNAESLANNVDIRQTVYPLLEPPAKDGERGGCVRSKLCR